jgi:hypothetical protein
MKKLLSNALLFLIPAFSFAQSADNTMVSQPAEKISPEMVFLIMALSIVAAFVYLVVTSLSQAVRILATRVSS